MNATCLICQNMFNVEGVSDVTLQHPWKAHLMPVKDNIKYRFSFFLVFLFFFLAYTTLTELKSIFGLM